MIIDIIVVLFFSILLFKLEAKKFLFAGLIYFYLYIIYIYTGTIMMYYDEFYQKDIYFEKLQTIVRGGFFSIILAYFTTYFTVKRKDIKHINLEVNLNESKKYAFSIVAGFIVLISTLYLIMIPNYPLFTMFTNPSQFDVIRESATTTFVNFGFYDNFFNFFLPMVWLIFLFQYKNKLFLFLFVLNIFISLNTGLKSPIVYFLFLLVLGMSLRNKQINYLKISFYFIISLTFLMALVVFQNWHLLNGLSLDSLELAWQGLQRRIFYGGVLPLKQYLEFFPQFMNHYYLSPPEIVPSKLVYAYAYPDTKIVGTANTISLGNLYAAFGNFSLVFILFYFISLFIFLFDRIWFNQMKNSFDYSVYIMFCLISVKLVMTDWYTLMPTFIIFTFSFFGAIYLIESFLHYFASSKKSFVFYAPNKIFAIFSILMFLYFFQGQIKGLILN